MFGHLTGLPTPPIWGVVRGTLSAIPQSVKMNLQAVSEPVGYGYTKIRQTIPISDEHKQMIGSLLRATQPICDAAVGYTWGYGAGLVASRLIVLGCYLEERAEDKLNAKKDEGLL